MSIVSLEKRITKNWDDFEAYKCSSDSYIFIKDSYITDAEGPDCLALTVGNCWYDNGRYINIDKKKGLKVRPHASIVLETAEDIALPLNTYGLLFGAGSNIYRGAFISGGKIDPGFQGKLKIGFHNGSDNTIVLKQGDKLAYCIFVIAENSLINKPFSHALTPPIVVMTLREKLTRWLMRNSYELFAIIIAAASLITSIIFN